MKGLAWRTTACGVCLFLTLAALRLTVSAGREKYDDQVKQTYNYRFGKNPYLPSEAQSENNEFVPPSALPTASYCAKCHQDIHKQWRQSAHANSFREPFYLRNVELLIKSKGIEFTRHCEACHNPIALFSGALTKESKVDRSFDKDGVTCMVCHSIKKIQGTSGTGSYVIGVPAVMVNPDGTPVPGTVTSEDILSRPDLHSRAVMRDFYRTPEFCAVCHKAAIPRSLNDYRWLRAFSVYDEWQESSWSRESLLPFYKKEARATCQTCHMPKIDARADYGAKHHQVTSHRWLGANTAIPFFYGYREQLRETEQFLKDAASIDIFGLSKNRSGEDQLIAPIDREKFALAAGETVTISVIIHNKRIGHSLVPEQRDFYECSVEFRARDANGRTFYHSGFLDSKGFLEERAHTYTNRLLSSSGKLLDLHQVWEMRIRAYDNAILSGRSDLVRYQFSIPTDARSPITLTAKLNYRRFRRGYTNFVLRGNPDYPIVEMASRSTTLNLGKNEGDPALDKQADLLRWNNYGIALIAQLEYRQAAEAFRKVVAIDPEYSDGYINFAVNHYTERIDNKREGSGGLLGLSIGNAPDGLGNLYTAKAPPEEFEPAVRALDRAVAISRDKLRARFHRGVVYRLQNKLDAAVEDLKPVVQAYPRFRQARQELGYVYLLQQRFEPAREQFEALQAINPDDLNAFNYLSFIYARLGMKDKAAQQLAFFREREEDVGVEFLAQGYWPTHAAMSNEIGLFHLHGHTLNHQKKLKRGSPSSKK